MSQPLRIRVKTRSGRPGVLIQNGQWIVRVKAAPQKGEANRELIALLAEFLGVSPSEVVLKRGLTAAQKTLNIPDRIDIAHYTGGTDG